MKNTKKTDNGADKIENERPVKNKGKKIGLAFAVIAAALFIIFMPKKTENSMAVNAPIFTKQGELTLSDDKGNPIVSMDIEIADDESRREIGMMGRTEMAERQGMLFVFEEEHYASFWMRNTILPLDMVFIDKQGRINTIHKNTKPFSDENYPASGLTLFVLEVNAGFTDKYGIKVGDMISWKRD